MKSNLDRIAKDLYGKIETRFQDIRIGDEEAKVLSKKTDIPKARFFEFEYKENGKDLGTVTITLDEDDGVVVQISGSLSDSKHPGAFKFLRSFRKFAKDRLLNFDVQNIGKSQLDKRDYEFQAKPKEQSMTTPTPIMENRLYGTSRMSYQDLGETRLIIKHSKTINQDLPAGRTMHIEGIWVENNQGERFRYPYKHLNGARAIAEHIKHGGTVYDEMGQYICGLSEELSQLRKFKGYVGRSDTLSEAMGGLTDVVYNRIDSIKKEIGNLQRSAYYETFAESFTTSKDYDIPEEILNDFVDRLTIRTFNEDLKSVLPYIFRLLDEDDIPVKELNADDILDEVLDGDKETGTTHKGGKVEKTKHGIKHTKTDYDDGNGQQGNKHKDDNNNRYKKYTVPDPEDQFESFINNFLNEDDTNETEDALFSPNKDTQAEAIDQLNQILQTELKAGPDGVNAIESLKGLIDDPEFLEGLKEIDPDLDTRPLIQQFIKHTAPDIVAQIHFGGGDEVGGANVEPPAPPAPAPAAPPEAAPPAPAPAAPPEAVPPAAPLAEDDSPPFDGPYRKRTGNVTDKSGATHTGHSQAKHLAKAGMIKAIHNAKKAGAKLDTKLDFGHKEMTLHDCIEECGMSPEDFGFEQEEHQDGVQEMLRDIAGFWNHEHKNFTIGGTRAKVKLVKGFKDGAYPNASEDDLRKVVMLIQKMDPSEQTQELDHIKHLAGVGHNVDEAQEDDDFSGMMQQFMQKHQGVDINQMLANFAKTHPDAKISQTNTSTGSINGKPASYDDAMNQFKNMKLKFGDQEIDPSNPQAMQGQIGNMMKGMMGKAQGQVPNQNVQIPGGQMNPTDMMKDIMGKINFGN